MPAGSERALVGLPHTFRPLGVRIAAYVLGGMLLVITLVIWFSLPDNVQEKFTLFQRGTVVAFGIGAVACGYALARCRIVAREDSLTVINGYRTRTLEWSQVLSISLRTGNPWATLDLSDGTTISAMAIQSSDGDRAVGQARQLRALIAAKTRTDRND